MGMWSRARQQYQDLVARYGKIAISTYFAIFFSVLFGFWFAVRSGVDLASGFQSVGIDASGAASGSGTFVVAYAFTKLTQPVRIAATLLLTPLIARVFGREPAELPAPATDGVEAAEG